MTAFSTLFTVGCPCLLVRTHRLFLSAINRADARAECFADASPLAHAHVPADVSTFAYAHAGTDARHAPGTGVHGNEHEQRAAELRAVLLYRLCLPDHRRGYRMRLHGKHPSYADPAVDRYRAGD